METMMGLSAGHYLEQAEEMLRQKDIFEFAFTLGKAELLAKNDQEVMARVTFLKIQGLFKFKQYKKALDSLPVALRYNSGQQWIKLKNYEGVMLGYQGNLSAAVEVFQSILPGLDDPELRVETYMNLVWAHLSGYRLHQDQRTLEIVKQYLDQADTCFEALPPRMKCKIIENLTVYYYVSGEHDKAIETAESAFQYYEEPDLAFVYNNLANMYLESDKDGVSELVNEYTRKAEIIGTKYSNYLEIAKSFYNKAVAELRDQQLFAALDTFYMSFEYFKRADALTLAFECLIKINQLMNDYKVERLKTMQSTLYEGFKGTPLYIKLEEGGMEQC